MEILTVIAIVVIISAIAVPAVMKAYSYAQASTLKLEVDALGNAFEQYRNKYGDYPPDGSNWDCFSATLPQGVSKHFGKRACIAGPNERPSKRFAIYPRPNGCRREK